MTTKTVRLTERIWDELFRYGIAETRTYRYCVYCTNFDGRAVIKRIRREYLDTTAVLSDASDSNPNGWEVLERVL
nr:MAG TPA: hypothetical protein [Caudoviricetes sp.]